jgi:hypothetical protein
MDIRLPSVAGTFYPASQVALHDDVEAYLSAVPPLPPRSQPKAIIAPHAGYIYSGPVAAFGYAAVRPYAQQIQRVVLLAPAHRLPFRGLAVPSADVFRTPLGDVPVDRAAVDRLLELPAVQTIDRAFDNEHAIEVQLPFMQEVLGVFSLVPVVVGMAEDGDVAAAIEALWGGEETLFVVSSDLSHYLDYQTARARDARTRDAIERLAPEQLAGDDACGYLAVRGLLSVARAKGMQVRTLDMRNSGDTAGPRDQVVGYGSYAVYP